MNNTIDKNVHERLGFDNLDKAEIVVSLNELIANYQIFFHKLQNFHWNVIGSDFFDVHKITENLYKKSLSDIDMLAERVRVFNAHPLSNISNALKLSNIKETSPDKSSEMMILETISDISILLSFVIEVYEKAVQNGDIGTSHMMSEMIQNLETNHWKLSSWSNNKYSH